MMSFSYRIHDKLLVVLKVVLKDHHYVITFLNLLEPMGPLFQLDICVFLIFSLVVTFSTSMRYKENNEKE